MVLKAHIDFETRSALDLKKVGMHRYAEDPSTEVLTMSYRLDEGPVLRWRPGEPWPVLTPDVVVAHNAGFERAILNRTLGKIIVPEDMDCTMARAAAMGLPQSLEALGEAIDADVKKDKDGARLMLKMCRPKTLDPLTWHEDPADVERLQAYCDRDVESESSADARLPPLSDREHRVWELDQRINDRGVAVDLQLIRRAQDAVGRAKRTADDRIWRLTGGAVRKCTEAKKIVDWLRTRGISTRTIAEDAHEDLIVATELFDDPVAAQVLELRRATAKAFKFQAMLDTVCRDGRVRGSLAYHGAHTGRWAGRGMQPQNFKRPDTEEEEALVAQTLNDLQAGVEVFSLEGLSLIARSMIVAPKGKKLVGGDFSNIEGRLNAWFAGEDWKLDAFRMQDAGLGPGIYETMASRVTGKDVKDVNREERQTKGKVPELACGYQGGRGAIQRAGVKAGIRIPNGQADEIKVLWRSENPAIVASWWELNDAAIEAVGSPGVVVPALRARVRYCSNGGFLFCQLPSGRCVSYAKPTVGWRTKIVDIDGDEVEINSRGVSYWGVHAGRWQKLDLYGGVLCNHVVQGTARDLLVEAMFKVEAAGYPIVLTVHDELLSEVDEGLGSAEEYAALMSEPPTWAEGLPLTTKAWEGDRYG